MDLDITRIFYPSDAADHGSRFLAAAHNYLPIMKDTNLASPLHHHCLLSSYFYHTQPHAILSLRHKKKRHSKTFVYPSNKFTCSAEPLEGILITDMRSTTTHTTLPRTQFLSHDTKKKRHGEICVHPSTNVCTCSAEPLIEMLMKGMCSNITRSSPLIIEVIISQIWWSRFET